MADPVKAGQLANAVADAFVVDQLDARFESAKRASGWLSDRIVEAATAAAKFGRRCCELPAAPMGSFEPARMLLSMTSSFRISTASFWRPAPMRPRRRRVCDFLAEVAAGKRSLDSLPASFQSTVQSGVMGDAASEARGRLAAGGRFVGAL